ncbi:hypothetical protein EMCRGX_G031306 [Ephydatia muelleri]|eukprot:Em0018g701a
MLARYNIILAGQYGVGKTSIFRKLRNSDGIEESMGLDRFTYQTRREEREIEVYLWDTGGIERYHEPLSSNYYRQCDAIILVYMRGDQQSLVALGEWVNDAKTYSHMKDSVMFSLWENSIDENAPSLGQLEKTFMEHSGIPSSLYFKVSAKTGFNLKEAFESVVTALDKRSVSGLSQSEEHHYVDLKTLHNQPDSESNSSHHTFCRC